MILPSSIWTLRNLFTNPVLNTSLPSPEGSVSCSHSVRYTGLADLGDDVPCPELVDDLLPRLRRLLAPSGDLGRLGHLLSLDGSLSKVSSHLEP